MKNRRFDTKQQMERFLDGNLGAFNHIYERYSGRMYRFIVRQCGTGPHARAIYLTVWAEFVDARKQHNSANDYKISLHKILHRRMKNHYGNESVTNETHLPSIDHGQDINWRIKLLEFVRQLPKELREVFLFRHEIGINSAIIARVLDESKDEIERAINQATLLLEQELVNQGYDDERTVAQLYRDSRILKSPSLWDNEIYTALPVWMELGIQNTLIHEQMLDKESIMRNITGSLNHAKKQVHELAQHTKQDLFKTLFPHRQRVES